ncbi:DUF4177 domain-containing protein [Salipiger pallidus]|uniref:DUF4177 domain-containing protein n=1 Tax=Salipiger pallidus TaxID=1775170 RepID=A0A8J2ZH14_9RHOB|nr:DUF4177 domain-containing protein [Salipiger pallidus]GGG62148.1 DUF4177 domain-containing protein [Salipiger pallidus]
MQRYEYKVLPAPAKGEKAKAVKGPEGRFAHSIERLMNEMAQAGWEYLRAETLPSEERSGLASTQTIWRNLLVFRREMVAPAAVPAPAPSVAAPETASGPATTQAPAAAPAPAPRPDRTDEGLSGRRLASAPELAAASAGAPAVAAPEREAKSPSAEVTTTDGESIVLSAPGDDTDDGDASSETPSSVLTNRK